MSGDAPYLGQDLIDPVCLAHGLPWSANPPHWAGKCLICQLCFKVLESTADCNSLGDGSYEDVCIECAKESESMALCSECLDHFIPDDYLDLCNSCGGQLLRQYEAMQEFRAGVMTIAELAAWATFGRSESVERCWRVG